MFGNSSYKNLIGKAGLEGGTDILNPDITHGVSAGDAVIYTIKQEFFSYAHTLPVMIFMLILYIIVTKSQV